MAEPIRFAILASHRASSFQRVYPALIEQPHVCWLGAISDDAGAPVLDFAQAQGVNAVYVNCKGQARSAYSEAILKMVEAWQINLLVLIGFKRIIGEPLLSRFRGRMVNLHPSLLPRHAGVFDLKVHEQVIAMGDPNSGCSLHFVTEHIDHGPVIAQRQCSVSSDETPQSLKEKVQQLESALLQEFLTKDAQHVIS